MRNYITYSILIVLMLAYALLYVPQLVEKTSKDALQKQVESFDNGLLTRIQENESRFNQVLVDLESQLTQIKQYEQVVRKIAESTEEEVSLFRAESGVISLSDKEIPSINNPNGCEANRGLVDKFIKFNRSFTTPPEVISAFTALDFGNGPDHRLKSEITNITNTGFTINFVTWCDTRMSRSQLKWLALGI